MKKNIAISSGGINSKVGKLLVNRLMPNRYIPKIGPFVFLDHLYPTEVKPQATVNPRSGEFAHPHRGIITFTYMFSGEMEHFDSKGNYGLVGAEGAQWMKSGNGIIHDEEPSPEMQKSGGHLHAVQFWINLPSAQKQEEGAYLALQSSDIPVLELPEQAGNLRLIIGKLGDKESPVIRYTEQFIYHIKLNPKSSFTLTVNPDLEYAAFVPQKAVSINQVAYENSQLVVFEQGGDEIIFSNDGIEQAELLVFGGERYTEPVEAEGPFVMNSRADIAIAYRDFFNGKYGTIDYSIATAAV
ncbi:pirin family protein [Desertivirga xinjiangensis]|uniref:pirin family protein n=1 Tax=Desertivirga xinjiangensis TaxID=539206 RepID=UPI00210EE010|nr:pirin family protein [Pedobacter xinjiangensis]